MAAVEGISSLRRRKRSTEASSPAPGDAYSVEPEHGANTSVGVRKDGEGSRGDAPLRGIPGGSVRSSGTDYALALCLFAVAVVVRFYKLSDVQSAVFDEGAYMLICHSIATYLEHCCLLFACTSGLTAVFTRDFCFRCCA